MIEVFKTDVRDNELASEILAAIHRIFIHYDANFDLQDCDCILRVKSSMEPIESTLLINLLKEYGYNAEILRDEVTEFAVAKILPV